MKQNPPVELGAATRAALTVAALATSVDALQHFKRTRAVLAQVTASSPPDPQVNIRAIVRLPVAAAAAFVAVDSAFNGLRWTNSIARRIRGANEEANS